MAIQLVNIGTSPNDGAGDPLRTAFQKINNNFVEMQQTSSQLASAVTIDASPNQVIFEYPVESFTQGTFQIQSYRDDNNDSQNAQINVQIQNDLTDVKYTVFGITIAGDWLTNYDMDVDSGNVRLLVSPLQDVAINHFISYQVTYIGDLGLGSSMITQNEQGLITEQQNLVITTEG